MNSTASSRDPSAVMTAAVANIVLSSIEVNVQVYWMTSCASHMGCSQTVTFACNYVLKEEH